ncbi:hypothetical protein A5724_10520 [Mycobacterium sp. ACS1612]|uniref:DUF4020 domain-containing protein n=1 Tax=Mycobacterium sp. ACS1612 TaxID=1834117 RepID=UPI000801F6AB|nr:DUF4020 domain-containing protein [Mycobacterium sp. ACS1612]OBF38154.1 hypothetical protein A5724_10520 [Mycobacterium sp. ACS1612]
MRICGVEFPGGLIEAHASDALVLFVGAGASMGPPSSLPSFQALVETIRDQSNLGAVIGDVTGRPLDELLGQMADKPHNVDVHKRAALLVGKPDSKPNKLHFAVARLAASKTVRIVTTNFDRHLETAIDQTVPVYEAPALPVGDDFAGLVYLHGRLGQEPRRLVLTDADFGRAYLTDAWAARFLDRMFAGHPVLFIGYSHSDVIMKYLARGLGRAKDRFILTPEPDSALWRQLGITPIGYEITPDGSHENLEQALAELAAMSSRGMLEHQEHVKALVDQQAPSLIPEDMSYLESIISDEQTVKFFTKFAQGELWLRWIAEKEEFRVLFTVATESKPTAWQLATWFAENYVTEEFSRVGLAVATQLGGHLGPTLASAIGRHLVARSMPLSPGIRPWLPLVTRDLQDRRPNFVDFALEKSSAVDDKESALFLFEHLTEPELRLSPGYFNEVFEIGLRGDDYWLRQAWRSVFQPVLPQIASEILAIVDQHIRSADRKLALVEDSSQARRRPSLYRAAIAPSPADDFPGPLGFLVDAARDCLEALLEAEAMELAGQYISSWASSDVLLLKRLALHGWIKRSDVDSSGKLRWLIDTGWLFDDDLRAEVFELIKQVLAQTDVQVANELVVNVAVSTDDRSRRWAFNALTLIAQAAPDLASAQEALAALIAQDPGLAELTATDRQADAEAPQLPTTVEDLRKAIDDDLGSVCGLLQQYEAFDRESTTSRRSDAIRWESFGALVSEVVGERPEDGFAILGVLGSDSTEVARLLIHGWTNARLNIETAERAIDQIVRLDLPSLVPYITQMLAGPASAPDKTTDWRAVPGSMALAKRCWDAIDPDAGMGQRSPDMVSQAINHPAGRLAEFWIAAVSEHWNQRGDNWSGLDSETSNYLKMMLNCGDVRSEMVEVIFAGSLRFFHRADPSWCEEHLLPRLKWDDEARAFRTWDGFLSFGMWTNGLLSAGLLGGLIETVAHLSEFRSDRGRRLLSLLAGIAIYAEYHPGEWLPQFLTSAKPEDRREWANRIAFHLSSLPADGAEEQWQRWMRQYWTDRLDSVPMPLDIDEASAMAQWPINLSTSMTEGVELALRHAARLATPPLVLHRLAEASSEEILRRDPEQIARLVAHILAGTESPCYTAFELPEVLEKLERYGASEASTRDIREQAMRLDIQIS